MAYNVRYYTSYKRQSNNTTTITIEQKDYSGSATELIADNDALTITTTGNVDNIYTPTNGSGAEIKLYVPALNFITGDTLFTEDPQEFIVKVYDGGTGDTITWQGFVNTGVYQEDYSDSGLVPIILQCNDGLQVLDNIKYQSISGSTYTGFTELRVIMDEILSKLAITFTEIYTVTDLRLDESNNNFFINLIYNNENFVDEGGKPMSCREVLNVIYETLGLTITFRGERIYMIDPITLRDATKRKAYNLTTYSQISSDVIGGYLDISAGDLSWYQKGTTIDIVKPFNELEVIFDPYNFQEGVYDFNGKGNTCGLSGWMSGGTAPDTYIYSNSIRFVDWSGDHFGNGIAPLNDEEFGDANYTLKLCEGQTGTTCYTFPYSNISDAEDTFIQLGLTAYVNTKNAENTLSPSECETAVKQYNLCGIYLKRGDYYWNQNFGNWTTSRCYIEVPIRQLEAKCGTAAVTEYNLWRKPKVYFCAFDCSRIDDRSTEGFAYAPLCNASHSVSGVITGSLSVEIDHNLTACCSDIHNILISDISVTTVDSIRDNIMNDACKTTYCLTDATSLKESKLSSTLKTGIGTGISRSAISSNTATPTGGTITGLQRCGSTNIYDTKDLIAQNLISQYYVPRTVITGEIDIRSNYLMEVEHSIIKDSDYLGTKGYYIVNGVYNDAKESLSATMIELANTRISLDPEASLELDNTTLSFCSDGTPYSTDTFNVTSNYDWDVCDDAAWLSLSDSCGSCCAALTVTASTNTTCSDRCAELEFSIDSCVYATATVCQDGIKYLELCTSSFCPAYGGDSETICVCSNVGWTVSERTAYSWLCTAPPHGLEDGTFDIEVTSNTTGSERTGYVDVSGVGVCTETVTVTQPTVVQPNAQITPYEGACWTFSTSRASISYGSKNLCYCFRPTGLCASATTVYLTVSGDQTGGTTDSARDTYATEGCIVLTNNADYGDNYLITVSEFLPV